VVSCWRRLPSPARAARSYLIELRGMQTIGDVLAAATGSKAKSASLPDAELMKLILPSNNLLNIDRLRGSGARQKLHLALRAPYVLVAKSIILICVRKLLW